MEGSRGALRPSKSSLRVRRALARPVLKSGSVAGSAAARERDCLALPCCLMLPGVGACPGVALPWRLDCTDRAAVSMWEDGSLASTTHTHSDTQHEHVLLAWWGAEGRPSTLRELHRG